MCSFDTHDFSVTAVDVTTVARQIKWFDSYFLVHSFCFKITVCIFVVSIVTEARKDISWMASHNQPGHLIVCYFRLRQAKSVGTGSGSPPISANSAAANTDNGACAAYLWSCAEWRRTAVR